MVAITTCFPYGPIELNNIGYPSPTTTHLISCIIQNTIIKIVLFGMIYACYMFYISEWGVFKTAISFR